jgi:hypothetical protein
MAVTSKVLKPFLATMGVVSKGRIVQDDGQRMGGSLFLGPIQFRRSLAF